MIETNAVDKSSRIPQGFLNLFLSRQFLMFVLVGLLNTAFGYGVFALLIWAGGRYQAALVVSTIAGVVFNFRTTGRWVFVNRRWAVLPRFFAGYAIILGINIVALGGLIGLGLSSYAGQAVSLPFLVILSFIINKFMVFRRSA